jgi:hypothetical protein
MTNPQPQPGYQKPRRAEPMQPDAPAEGDSTLPGGGAETPEPDTETGAG